MQRQAIDYLDVYGQEEDDSTLCLKELSAALPAGEYYRMSGCAYPRQLTLYEEIQAVEASMRSQLPKRATHIV